MENQNSNAIIHGGRDIPAAFLDGTQAPVFVRLVAVAELAKFLSLIETETALAEFVCDKPEGWAATLTPESLLDVAEAATDLNFSTACRWAERRVKIGEAAMPIMGKAERLKNRAASPSSPPKPA